MTYRSTDLFDASSLTSGDTMMVNRDGVTYQVDITEWQDLGADRDLIIVNRGGKSFNCRKDQIPAGIGITRDTDLILVNRGNKSYRVTIGELRGQLSQPVTFTVSIQTAALKYDVRQPEATTCEGNNYTMRCDGGRLTATVTAMSTDSFSFTNNVLSINNEWVVCCGSPGGFGFKNSWFMIDGAPKVCFYYNTNNQQRPTGLSSIGVSNIGPGEQGEFFGQAPGSSSIGTYARSGDGGYGCAPGATQENSPENCWGFGGASQTRPRAEDSGDTYNGITVTNAAFTTHSDESGYGRISANGKTLTGSGIIGSLL